MGIGSWRFFEQMLYEANVVGTPGVGFGPSGEGYIRLTAFGKSRGLCGSDEENQKTGWYEN